MDRIPAVSISPGGPSDSQCVHHRRAWLLFSIVGSQTTPHFCRCWSLGVVTANGPLGSTHRVGLFWPPPGLAMDLRLVLLELPISEGWPYRTRSVHLSDSLSDRLFSWGSGACFAKPEGQRQLKYLRIVNQGASRICRNGQSRVERGPAGSNPRRSECAYSESEVGCFRSSEGFSQATPTCGASPRLILLPFGGIPNSPGSRSNASGVPSGSKVPEVTPAALRGRRQITRPKSDKPVH